MSIRPCLLKGESDKACELQVDSERTYATPCVTSWTNMDTAWLAL